MLHRSLPSLAKESDLNDLTAIGLARALARVPLDAKSAPPRGHWKAKTQISEFGATGARTLEVTARSITR